jgi:hypothetical protein
VTLNSRARIVQPENYGDRNDALHLFPSVEKDFSGSVPDWKELDWPLLACLGKNRTFHTSAMFL